MSGGVGAGPKSVGEDAQYINMGEQEKQTLIKGVSFEEDIRMKERKEALGRDSMKPMADMPSMLAVKKLILPENLKEMKPF